MSAGGGTWQTNSGRGWRLDPINSAVSATLPLSNIHIKVLFIVSIDTKKIGQTPDPWHKI